MANESKRSLKYRVFPAIGKQEGGWLKLTLTLLRAQRASMSPKDWKQITFRSEMHFMDFRNESDSQLEIGKNQDLLILAQYTTGCSKMVSCFNKPLCTECDFN